jgi:hypothetical protein
MGTDRVLLGFVVEMKPWRKHGNGAKGGGRLGGTGKKCSLFKIDKAGNRELVAKIEGSTAKEVLRQLRASHKFIPTNVTINQNGETFI